MEPVLAKKNVRNELPDLYDSKTAESNGVGLILHTFPHSDT